MGGRSFDFTWKGNTYHVGEVEGTLYILLPDNTVLKMNLFAENYPPTESELKDISASYKGQTKEQIAGHLHVMFAEKVN